MRANLITKVVTHILTKDLFFHPMTGSIYGKKEAPQRNKHNYNLGKMNICGLKLTFFAPCYNSHNLLGRLL